MSNKQNDIFYENLEEMTDREKSIREIDIIKNWYSKQWISYQEYLRLTDLAF